MRKVLLLPFMLLLTCVLAQSAQARATLGEARVDADATGNIIRWRTTFELDNIGFNIFRVEGGGYSRLNRAIIPGSVLKVGDKRPLSAGGVYSWTDSAGAADSRYYLEFLALDGERTFFGPLIPGQGDAGASLSSLPASLEGQDENGPQSPSVGHAAAAQGARPEARTSSTLAAREQASQSALQTQQAIAALSCLKVLVNRTGWYRITQPELVAAGLDPNTDSRNLHLYVNGAEVPLRVNGAAGPLAAGDSIEFYGVALDIPTTDTQVYWLVADAQAGQRLAVSGGQTSAAPTTPQSFPYTAELKDRSVYFSALLNGDAENFFGAVIASAPVTQTLTLPHLDAASSAGASLEMALQGVTYQNHQIQVYLNNSTTPLTTLDFSFRSRTVFTVPVSVSALQEGDNTLKFVGVKGDISLVDYLRLTYPHTYQADNDALSFSAQGGQVVAVDGFTTSQIRVLDITDPNAVQEITPSVIQQRSAYALRFVAGGTGTRSLYAFADARTLHPAAINGNLPSTLSSSGNGADLVIISYRDFLQSVQPLAALRRSQGLKVSVVDVEDIYDEFSFGVHTTQAVKDFLYFTANNWTTHPKYVLLMGRGSYDPRNYLHFGNFDFVPTKLVDATYSEAASDEWLADFDGDHVAEMAIGRLSAKTVAEADLMVSKTVNYAPAAVNRTALFVADASDPGFTFEQDNRDAAATLPSSIVVQYIDRIVNGSDSVTRSQIIDGINKGPMLVNYAGHGNLEVWRSVFTSKDASALSNGNHLPLFILMTCLNGYFTEPNPVDTALADALLKAPNGGGVAVWASSGETVPSGQQVMNRQLYQSLFSGQNTRLGDAIRNAKLATYDPDVRLTWVLFGDPTFRLDPAISINNTSVTLDSAQTTQAIFTVSLSAAPNQSVTVKYSTADGTAKAGVDYAAASGVITFNPGETTKTIAVTVNPETGQGPGKNFFVNLSEPTNASIEESFKTGTASIVNPNVAGTLQLSAAAYTVVESASSALVTVTRTGGKAGGLTVNFSTSDGTAKAGSDYVSTTGTLTFGYGEMSKTISVPLIDDTLNEGNETFSLTLSSPTGGAALGAQSTAVLTIIDDDATVLHFASDSYSVREDAKFASISVTRSGDLSHTATVDYNTAGGTARQRSDYTASSGTVTFAPGEASRSFTVLITNNAFIDGDRTINLALGNPVGGIFAGHNTAVLTIHDDDISQPSTNPSDDAEFFVRQQYADLLSRSPDDDGLGYWTSEITRCGTDPKCIHDRRVGVADAFFFETEFQQTGGYIYRVYRAAVGRKPTYAEFMADRGHVVASTDLEQSKNAFALGFIKRAEFKFEYSAATNAAQFVDRMLAIVRSYSNVDLSSQRSALIALYDGTDEGKAAILRRVAESQSFIDAEYNNSFVLMEYFGYLRRDPEPDGFAFWLEQVNKYPLRNVSIQHAMACSFITSAEYQTRFSSVVTHTNQECPQ